MATMTIKIEPESIVQDIVARVRPYLERNPIQNIVPQIIEDALHLEEGWWYIPVRFSSQEPRTYEYYDRLTEIEDEIAAQEHLQVLFVPAG